MILENMKDSELLNLYNALLEYIKTDEIGYYKLDVLIQDKGVMITTLEILKECAKRWSNEVNNKLDII